MRKYAAVLFGTWLLLAFGLRILRQPTHVRLNPIKPGECSMPTLLSPYSLSVQHALRHAHATHQSSYFRELAAALLAAPKEAAAARRPHHCVVDGAAGSPSNLSIHPISFSIPISFFQDTVPPKMQDFSSVVPGLPSTYRFKVNVESSPAAILAAEDDYHKDISRSVFGVTYKKGGWDCMRHLEIIAAGTLPVFTDIFALPSGTMAAYPVKVLQLLKNWPGVVVQGLPATPPGPGGKKQGEWIVGDVVLEVTRPIDRPMYQLATQAMLQYGKAMLSTAGMAKYFMETVGIQPYHRVLYFGSGGHDARWFPNDYLADTLLHGLQSVMSVPVVDHPRTEGLYVDHTTFTEEEMASCKTQEPRYGGGFSYAYRMHEPFGIDRTNITQKLEEPLVHFDYIVFAVAFRKQWDKQGVCGKWPRDRVIFLLGGDFFHTTTVQSLQWLHECGAHIFMREMHPGCVEKHIHPVSASV